MLITESQGSRQMLFREGMIPLNWLKWTLHLAKDILSFCWKKVLAIVFERSMLFHLLIFSNLSYLKCIFKKKICFLNLARL